MRVSDGAQSPHCIHVLTLGEGQINDITAFLSPDLFPRFELPASVRTG